MNNTKSAKGPVTTSDRLDAIMGAIEAGRNGIMEVRDAERWLEAHPNAPYMLGWAVLKERRAIERTARSLVAEQVRALIQMEPGE